MLFSTSNGTSDDLVITGKYQNQLLLTINNSNNNESYN